MLAAAALVAMIVLAAIVHDGPAWIIQGVFGLAAAVTGLRAGGHPPGRRPARSSGVATPPAPAAG